MTPATWVDPWGLATAQEWAMLGQDRGYIHRLVQANIVATRYPLIWPEVVIPSGRVDLLWLITDKKKNPVKSFIWDVKPSTIMTKSYDYNQMQIQLRRYTNSRYLGKPIDRGPMSMSGSFSDGIFAIWYWSSEPGVILYDFQRFQPHEQKQEQEAEGFESILVQYYEKLACNADIGPVGSVAIITATGILVVAVGVGIYVAIGPVAGGLLLA